MANSTSHQFPLAFSHCSCDRCKRRNNEHANAAMVKLETAAKKDMIKFKTSQWKRLTVFVFRQLNKSVRQTVLMMTIGGLGYSLLNRVVMGFDYYIEQGDMATAGAIWVGMFVLFIFMMWFLF
ncbi:hypothetical protein BTUL_0144g00330 [Botrytis tulipae]|uniref:Uncharacterized protein n=1 Tax=Botrytis tulipae TaxID=87230 RepID=A0A4Z1EFU7_9HELO|nr:hypothetical protein BTUL_0144g00330 [Botrytis tulipae]